jgi:hypothetical protein
MELFILSHDTWILFTKALKVTGNDTRADVTKFTVVLHTMGTTVLLELDKIGFGTEKDQTAGLS